MIFEWPKYNDKKKKKKAILKCWKTKQYKTRQESLNQKINKQSKIYRQKLSGLYLQNSTED